VAALQFHAAILAAAGNPLLRPLAALAAVAPGRAGAGDDTRAGLLEAIRRQDEAAASACMQALLAPDEEAG
jgi:DNA-binding FadR family transcriptional regulator